MDGLRGIAALMIVVYHAFTESGNPEWRIFGGFNVLRIVHDGWCGVNLFLVLSGFCLFWPYARDERRRMEFGKFMQKRFWRIVPAYYASLLLVPLLEWFFVRIGYFHQPLSLPKDAADFVLHLLLLQSLSPEAIWSWNGVTWSLGLEWTWYLCFPLAVWLFRKRGAGFGMMILVGITIVYSLSAFFAFGPNAGLPSKLGFTLRSLLPARLAEFGFGMFAAWYLARYTPSARQTKLALLSLGPLFVLAHMAMPIELFFPVRQGLYGLAFFLVVALAGSARPNVVRTVCEWRWTQRLGESSYSLYLFHLPFLRGAAGFLASLGINGPARFFLSLLTIPAILVIARWCYLFFEKPFLARRTVLPPGNVERAVPATG